MKRNLKTHFILAAVLVFGGFIMSACTASERSAVNNSENAVTGTAQQTQDNKSNSAEKPKETPKPSPEKSVEPDVSGKYECCEIGVEGEYSLELKANNTVAYKEKHEDSDSEGKGSWNWDKNKEFINVDLNVATESYGGEDPEKPMKTSAKVTFKLKKDGKDLRIADETLSQRGSEGYYIGKTFKKL